MKPKAKKLFWKRGARAIYLSKGPVRGCHVEIDAQVVGALLKSKVCRVTYRPWSTQAAPSPSAALAECQLNLEAGPNPNLRGVIARQLCEFHGRLGAGQSKYWRMTAWSKSGRPGKYRALRHGKPEAPGTRTVLEV